MKVFCPALLSGKYIPTKCAHRDVKGGQNVSPAVEWTEVPGGTESFALSIIDRHPVAKNWVHWYVINMPATARAVSEHASGVHRALPGDSMELRNSYGDNGYGGPNPPRGSGAHEYEITVYALDIPSLDLGPYATLKDCTAAMHGHLLASATVVGSFQQ
jgi:Raf kinase inhibitor-like YbhB/YbcL family protein